MMFRLFVRKWIYAPSSRRLFMRLPALASLLVLVAGLCGCDAASETKPQATAAAPVAPGPIAADALGRLARGSNAFGFDLFKRVRAKPGNLVVSPASITTALAMTWGGAKGETAEQMQRVLRFEGAPAEVMDTSGKLAAMLQDPARPITFRIVNRLFGDKAYQFDAAYLAAMKIMYRAPLEPLDFKNAFEPARATINGWVEQQTNKRIAGLIPQGGVNGETRLVLVNAICFLGDWTDPFDKAFPAPFSTTPSARKDVPTMHREGRFRLADKDGVKALELPYKGNAMSMLIVLPNEPDGLDAVETSLDAAKLDALARAASPQQVAVALPKFEIAPANSLSLRAELVNMGMVLAFDRVRADFTGIANPPSPADRLFISQVFHKAFVRVDEKGTEAAAATAVVAERVRGGISKLVQFKADHPFLFFIRDTASGLVLFAGRVADPSIN